MTRRDQAPFSLRLAYLRAREGGSVVIPRHAAVDLVLKQPKAAVVWEAWLDGDVCVLRNGYTVQRFGEASATLKYRGKP